MQLSIRVVTAAQNEALTAFVQLSDLMIGLADSTLNDALRNATTNEQRLIMNARAFLRAEGGSLRLQIKAAYQGLLERAMRTMHNDLRTGLGELRADSLSLIEDDVVTREIEVVRLVTRLRDADQLSLGHLNLIIAQLHGVSEVSERENPFRPYLLARALHETLRKMLDRHAPSELIFQHLSMGMTAGVAKFYSRILAVFESQGVRSRLLARPSALSRYERDRLALKKAADQLMNGKTDTALDDPETEMRSRMLPRMQRMLELVQYDDGSANQQARPRQAKDLQDLVWEVFHQPRGTRLPRKAPVQAGRSQLEQRLDEMQRAVSEGASHAPADAPLALRDRFADLAAPQDRLTIDLVALLFDFILNDEQMCQPMREQIVRLHVPFLRAAVQQPALLHDPAHPARRLLDRAGTIAVTVGCGSLMDDAMLREMERIVLDIQKRFEDDVAVFAQAEAALDRFFAAQQALHDPAIARAAAALARAEVAAPVLDAMRARLRELLAPIQADRRMIEFIVVTWSQVMVHCHDTHPAYRAMLPELLWSAQEKPGPDDRTILLRLLPDLGRRLRAGLAQIGMPEAQAKEALDKLVVVHMDVLANKRLRSNAVRRSQRALNEELSAFNTSELFTQAREQGLLAANPQDLVASLAAAGIEAATVEEPAQFFDQTEDADYLQWARPGTPFEVLDKTEFRAMMLEVASASGLSFLFRQQQGGRIIYTRKSLLAAMRDGSLRPVEHAPLFERAVESLMTGAESLAA